MNEPKYQVMPEMGEEEYNDLKADIAERGVMVPIEFDEDGNVLDGHHRLRACEELGITDYPTKVREGMTEDEKVLHAYKLNTARRNLTPDQMLTLVAGLLRRYPTKSNREIAGILGISHPTVGKYRKQLEQLGQVEKVTTREGADGKTYTVHGHKEGRSTFTCCICGVEAPAYYKQVDGKLVNVWGFDPWPTQEKGDCCQDCWLSILEVVSRMPKEARYRHYLGPHWRKMMEVAQAMVEEDHEKYGDYKAHRDPVEFNAEFDRRLQEMGITDVWH